MTTDTVPLTDPLLVSTLAAASRAREQSLAILDLLEQHHSTPPVSDQPVLSRHQKLLNAHLAQLRTLHRKAVISARTTKQETAEARQEIDSLHLQLQNLYYEQRHLRGEIEACEGYEHRYRSLPLIPTEEFLSHHPELNEASEHDVTIARMKDEHAARQGLEYRRLELVKQKEGLVKEANARKDELAKLDAEIEKWIGGQESVRKAFEAREKKTGEKVS